jgi:peptide/nickel transport system substrate-binding protein
MVPAAVADTGSSGTEKVFRASWGASGGDWGFPSPLAFYPRGPGYTMMSFCFDTLVWPDSTGNFIGLLAKSWDHSADGLTWTFDLRDNVTWHDGVKFTANDVKFTYEYLKNSTIISISGSSWYDLSYVQNVTVLNDYKVQIKLNKPYGPFISQIAAVVPIMPEHIWKDVADPSKFKEAKAAIGTGPFLLKDYNAQAQTYDYVANQNYYLGRPAVDELQFIPVSDAVLALKKGDIEEAGATLDQVQALNDSKNINIVQGDGYWVYRLRFNIANNTVLNNTDVRKAMYYALNCNDILDKVLHGGGVVGNSGYVPPYSMWYNPDVTQYTYSPDKASKLLDQAGFSKKDADGIRLTPDGKRLEFQLLYTSDQQSQRIAELVQSYFKNVGIGITLKPGDSKVVDGLVAAGNFEVAIYSHGTGTDPSKMINNLPASTGWNNSQFTALGKQQVSAADDAARKSLVDQMQVLIADNVPTIPMLYRNVYSASNGDKFTGFFFTPGGIGGGVPTEYNKLVFVYGKWKTQADASATATPAAGNGDLPLIGILSVVVAAAAMLVFSRKFR